MATNWNTIGHDEKRTFCSDGDIPGALTLAWQYNAANPTGWNISRGSTTSTIVGDASNIYLRYSADTLTYSAIEKVSSAGSRVWQNPYIGFNNDESMSCCKLPSGQIVVNDDGISCLNDIDGTRGFGLGLDTWGNICPDPTNSTIFYTSNWLELDYEGVYLKKLTTTGTQAWDILAYQVSSGAAKDLNGSSIAFENNIVYYAPRYKFVDGIAHLTSGVYAVDPSNGGIIWSVASNPTSHLSIGSNYLFLCEDNSLVARSKLDGSKIWSQPLPGTVIYNTLYATCVQSPVIVGSIVIMGTTGGIFAYNQSTGASVWSNTSVAPCTTSSNGYHLQQFTFMAAATTSNTLVVTGSDLKVHVLSLVDGSDLWNGLSTATAQYYLTNPIIIGNKVYVADAGGNVIALQSGGTPATVDNTAPTVSITNPANNATLSNSVSVTATASDNVALSQIQLFINGSLLTTSYTSPLSYTLNTKNYLNGSYSIVAVATDSSGNTANSSVNVAISNVADTTAPTVTISSPVNGSQLSSAKNNKIVPISVVASDNVAVSRISLMIDNKTVTSITGSTTPLSLSYNWNTQKVASGAHTITAVATDSSGNQAITSITVYK